MFASVVISSHRTVRGGGAHRLWLTSCTVRLALECLRPVVTRLSSTTPLVKTPRGGDDSERLQAEIILVISRSGKGCEDNAAHT